MIYVSIDVPFTESEKFSSVVAGMFQKRIIYDYDSYDNARAPSRIIEKNGAFIEDYFSIIHGHFYASKYLKVFKHPRLITMLTHPVSRLKSHFYYIKSNESTSDDWYAPLIKNDQMNIRQFSDIEGIYNCYSLHLSGLGVSDLFFVGISEYFVQSCRLFSMKANTLYEAEKTDVENHPSTVTEDEDLDLFLYDRCRADCEIYAEAVQRFESECSALQI